MGQVEVEISMSIDGYITGPDEHGAGLGEGGEILHAWFTHDPDGRRLLDDALFATSGDRPAERGPRPGSLTR